MSNHKNFFDADGVQIKVGDHVKCSKGAKCDHLVIRDKNSGELVRYIDGRALSSFKRVYLSRPGGAFHGTAEELDTAEAGAVSNRPRPDASGEDSTDGPDDREAEVRSAEQACRETIETVVGRAAKVGPPTILLSTHYTTVKLIEKTKDRHIKNLSLWCGFLTLYAAAASTCIIYLTGA